MPTVTPSAPSAPWSMAAIDALTRAEFVGLLGGIFEHSPWVAEGVADRRPFATVDALHAAMRSVVEAAPRERKLALLNAHPELAGREARAGSLTASSTAEQARAGLDALSAAEVQRIAELNAAYRARFGFPFIVAVRDHTKASIFATFEARLAHDPETEFAEALRQVYRITRLRLDTLAANHEEPALGKLSTHVLDLVLGLPARGMRFELSRIGTEGRTVLLDTFTNEDGRTEGPMLAGDALAAGKYELRFHVSEYFAAQRIAQGDPPFLDEVCVRFTIADPGANYHVPLLVTPWSYSTYRGS